MNHLGEHLGTTTTSFLSLIVYYVTNLVRLVIVLYALRHQFVRDEVKMAATSFFLTLVGVGAVFFVLDTGEFEVLYHIYS